jgi:eukaryotic-like serine/threonine-protein kinase
MALRAAHQEQARPRLERRIVAAHSSQRSMTPTVAPRVVGRYLLCDAIASGGMATVHLARLMGPEGFSRTVAVKQLHPQFSHDPEFVAMFLDEARLASRVRHPNVVSPLDVISCPPELFMVMEYVHGEPLSRLLKKGPLPQPVPPPVAAAIVGQILLGLHAAHEATGEGGEPLELVHRDVSPHNIMVTKDGAARIVDFGIAKAKARSHQTDPGKLKGKLGYMAPEQVTLGRVDRRADVFAVGVVLWEMLVGRRLFTGDSPAALVDSLLHAEIELPSRLVPGLPVLLDHVLLHALARPMDERFDTARAMAQALEHAVAPCGMLELSRWVESLAGDALDARAELVHDVEALRFDDFTQALPYDLLSAEAGTSRVAKADERAKDSVEPAALSLPSVNGGGRALRKGWLVAAGTFAIGIGLFALWGLVLRAPVSASVAGQPAATLAPQAVHATTQPALTVEDAGETLPTSKLSAAGSAAPTLHGKPISSARPKPASNCDVPYTKDKNGVKRFKEECF